MVLGTLTEMGPGTDGWVKRNAIQAWCWFLPLTVRYWISSNRVPRTNSFVRVVLEFDQYNLPLMKPTHFSDGWHWLLSVRKASDVPRISDCASGSPRRVPRTNSFVRVALEFDQYNLPLMKPTHFSAFAAAGSVSIE